MPITVNTVGELAAALETKADALQQRRVSIQDIGEATIMALSAVAILARQIELIEAAMRTKETNVSRESTGLYT